MQRPHRIVTLGMCALAAGAFTMSSASLDAQAPADVQKAVDAAFAKFKTLAEGKNADYIPALA